MQIYHKATISEKCIFASQIVLDSISETLTLLISRGRMLPDNPISRNYGLATPYSSKPKFCHPLSQCLNETLHWQLSALLVPFCGLWKFLKTMLCIFNVRRENASLLLRRLNSFELEFVYSLIIFDKVL